MIENKISLYQCNIKFRLDEIEELREEAERSKETVSNIIRKKMGYEMITKEVKDA